MKKVMLTDKRAAYSVRINHYVTLNDFSAALTDHFYGESELSDDDADEDEMEAAIDLIIPKIKELNKKSSEGILRDQLRNYGTQGEYTDGFFEASYVLGEFRTRIFELCKEWIVNKYPHLKHKGESNQ